jgi:hypothetical protein
MVRLPIPSRKGTYGEEPGTLEFRNQRWKVRKEKTETQHTAQHQSSAIGTVTAHFLVAECFRFVPPRGASWPNIHRFGPNSVSSARKSPQGKHVLCWTRNLCCRSDSDIIVRKVCKTNLGIENVEMKDCRGTKREQKTEAHTFTNIFKRCSKLGIFTLHDTHVNSSDFYRLLCHIDRLFDCVSLMNATEMDARCYAKASIDTCRRCNSKGTADKYPEEIKSYL